LDLSFAVYFESIRSVYFIFVFRSFQIKQIAQNLQNEPRRMFVHERVECVLQGPRNIHDDPLLVCRMRSPEELSAAVQLRPQPQQPQDQQAPNAEHDANMHDVDEDVASEEEESDEHGSDEEDSDHQDSDEDHEDHDGQNEDSNGNSESEGNSDSDSNDSNEQDVDMPDQPVQEPQQPEPEQAHSPRANQGDEPRTPPRAAAPAPPEGAMEVEAPLAQEPVQLPVEQPAQVFSIDRFFQVFFVFDVFDVLLCLIDVAGCASSSRTAPIGSFFFHSLFDLFCVRLNQLHFQDERTGLVVLMECVLRLLSEGINAQLCSADGQSNPLELGLLSLLKLTQQSLCVSFAQSIVEQHENAVSRWSLLRAEQSRRRRLFFGRACADYCDAILDVAVNTLQQCHSTCPDQMERLLKSGFMVDIVPQVVQCIRSFAVQADFQAICAERILPKLSQLDCLLSELKPSCDDVSQPTEIKLQIPVFPTKMAESTHRYSPNMDQTVKVEIRGAKFVLVQFDPKCSTESQLRFIFHHVFDLPMTNSLIHPFIY
jgi:hypothetical protein